MVYIPNLSHIIFPLFLSLQGEKCFILVYECRIGIFYFIFIFTAALFKDKVTLSLVSLCQSQPFSFVISSLHRLAGLSLALSVSRGTQFSIFSRHFFLLPVPCALQSSILAFLLSFLYLPHLWFFSYLSICYLFVPSNSYILSLHFPESSVTLNLIHCSDHICTSYVSRGIVALCHILALVLVLIFLIDFSLQL